MALLTCNHYLAICEGFEPELDTCTGPLITVPDDALTIVDIIQRYSRGIPLPTREAIYDEDVDLLEEDEPLQALSDVIDMQQDLLANAAKSSVDRSETPSSETEKVSTEQDSPEA